MSCRPRWERVAAVLFLLLFIAPFGYFAILWSQHKTIGVDFARVGERYDPNKIPAEWKVVRTHSLTLQGKTLRLYHLEQANVMLPEEHGIVVDSDGLISEVIRGDDTLNERMVRWEEAGALKR